MEKITSVKNEQVRFLARLKQKKYRQEEGLYLVEGEKIIEEAVLSGAVVQWLVCDERKEQLLETIPARHKMLTSLHVLAHISSLQSPPGVLAAVQMCAEEQALAQGLWVFLDGIADPANAAAIVRSADAAGFAGVFLAESVDRYNDKFLRAAMGSNYHIALQVVEDKVTFLSQLKRKGFSVIAACLDGETDVSSADENLVLVIGNEAHGISEEVLALSDKKITIPIYGRAESLNAACAASILMYAIRGFIQ